MKPFTGNPPRHQQKQRHSETADTFQGCISQLASNPISVTMSNPPGTERFDGYSAELNLVTADLSQKLDTIPEQSGETRNATVSAFERLIEEANELITSMKMEKASVPQESKQKVAQRLRNHESDLDGLKRRLIKLSSDKAQLFGSRYRDDPEGAGDDHLEQRQQLLSGTDRLNRSSNRLRESQRIANETEQIGAGTLSDLAGQRTQLEHTRERLLESEGYTDRSIKTLRGMARR